jgi:hypothetical protein
LYYAYYEWQKNQNYTAMDRAFENCVKGVTAEERSAAIGERTKIDHGSFS